MVSISVFDLFSVGIGPSSSHTVGPMRAGAAFAAEVLAAADGRTPEAVTVDLYGSLAATGCGHGTPAAIALGLEGCLPESVDPTAVAARAHEIEAAAALRLGGGPRVHFDADDAHLHPRTQLPHHTNGMRFTARFDTGAGLEAIYYSVGGGFIERARADGSVPPPVDRGPVPHPFDTAAALVALAQADGAGIAEIMLDNEIALHPEPDPELAGAAIRDGLLHIWSVMSESIERGFTAAEGRLPGGLNVPRRAPGMYRRVCEADGDDTMDWLSVAAIAVNEENACGGRVVTAPTNGAAGIVPAVLYWALHFRPALARRRDDTVCEYLLTAAAIAVLFKSRASISGAEVGCQGEVGSACAMAAGALAQIRGGSPAQVENAAEIGIEHNLGLTCDPIGGLVQIPCIERNAIAAVKAVAAARIAMGGDGTHRVSLDQAIETMRQTGADMLSKYKETSLGGLAVNVTEC